MKKLLLAFMLWMGITGTAYAANYGQMLYGSTTYPYNTYFSTGSNGTCLTSNGTIPVWGSCGGGGTPGGSNGQLQYNNAGSFAGTSSPVVGYITATSTTASSTLPTLSSSNFFTNAIALGASAISYIQSLFTGGTGISVSGGTITNTGVTSLGSVTGAIATGTITCSGTASCGAGSYVLGSNLTITGSGSASGLGTSSPWTVGNLAYVSSQGAVSSVGTTSLTATSPLSLSQPISVIGSSASALTCPTCNTSNASVSSVGLSSTNSTLTIGSTPVTTSGTITADLNLSHSNTWVAGQTFGNATTTNLSVTGNVGVGTTNPLKPFHVLESTSNGVALFERSTSGTFGGFTTFLMQADASGTPSNGFGPSFDFYANNATNTLGNKIGFVQAYTDNNSTTTGDLEFYTVNAGVNTPMMVMLYNGKTGIGTTTPATTLDVNGDITDESVKSQGCIGTDSTGKIINGTCSGTNYFTNSGATTTLTTGSVLQATTATTSDLCLGGVCNTSWPGGTNYFSNSGATTSLSTGNVVSASNGYFGLVTATTSMEAPFYDIPTTLSSTQGVITQNGVPIINMYNTGDNQNVFLGTSAGNFNSGNADNVAVGRAALNQSTNAYGDMAIGDSALYSNTTGTYNIALGKNALVNNTSGGGNFSAAGLASNITGNANVGLGAGSVGANQYGSYNIGFGYQPISLATTLNYDIGIGWRAGYSLFGSSGIDNNIFIGTQSDVTTAASTSMSQSTAIGYMAKVGCSYCMALGGTGSNAVNVGIGVTNPTTPLMVNGTASVSNIVSSSTATSTFAGSVQVTAGTIVNNELTIATSSTMTINWSQATQQLVKLGHAAVTINMAGYIAGEVLRVPICQDGTGGATVTWDSKIMWASSTPPTLSGANHCDLMTFVATNGTSTLYIMGGYINF